MTDPDQFDLPDGFVFDRAAHGDRVEAADGTRLVVLQSARTGERELVHADVVEYDGLLDHPMTTGVVGFLAILTAFLAPIAGGVYAVTTAPGVLSKAGFAVGAVIWAYVLANLLLYRTRLGDWLWRFLEWNDHRTLLARGME